MVPYTYLLKHIPTNKFYYGVRYAKGCSPNDFWNIYYTSSKYVHSLIKEYGKTSFDFEIRKIFISETTARNWEKKVLRRMRAVSRNDFLNKNDGYGPPIMRGKDHPLFGIGHSEEAKERMRKPHRKFNEEIRNNMSLARRGTNNPCFGKFGENHPAYGSKHTEDFKQRLSDRMKRNHPTNNIEVRNKISLSNKKWKWWNDGNLNLRSIDFPGEGWIRGRLLNVRGENNPMYGKKRLNNFWWTDGVNFKRCSECPGGGWIRGKHKIGNK